MNFLQKQIFLAKFIRSDLINDASILVAEYQNFLDGHKNFNFQKILASYELFVAANV